MKALHALPLAFCLPLAGACGPLDAGEVCNQNGLAPTAEEVADGQGKALVDGSPWEGSGSWAPGSNASVDIGTLSMVIAVDETGTEVADLIARRAFPICVPLGARSEKSGNASFEGSFITDENHTGGVAILEEDGGLLLGRFSLDLQSPSTGDSKRITEGAFRVERR
jgi:hypothetical protein